MLIARRFTASASHVGYVHTSATPTAQRPALLRSPGLAATGRRQPGPGLLATQPGPGLLATGRQPGPGLLATGRQPGLPVGVGTRLTRGLLRNTTPTQCVLTIFPTEIAPVVPFLAGA